MSGNEDDVKELEVALGVALGRVDAPQGFAERVMARVPMSSKVHRFPVGRQAWMGSVAASLLVGALVFGGVEHRRAEEKAKAERDFARSLEITDQAMEMTRERLQKMGVFVD